MTSAPSSGLVEGTTSLLNSEKYSDLTITTQTGPLKVHKAIVCTQSKVLAAMSDSGFRETSTSNLVLEDDDPATVERMVTFFYTGNYDDGNAAITATDAESSVGPVLMANTLVYAIAEKYDIGRLKRLANAKFRKIHCCTAWKCEEFLNVVSEVFDTTPDQDLGLRSVVSNTCARHIDDVLASEKWKELLADNGAIGLSVLEVAHQRFIAKYTEMEKKMEGLAADVENIRSVLFNSAMPIQDS